MATLSMVLTRLFNDNDVTDNGDDFNVIDNGYNANMCRCQR